MAGTVVFTVSGKQDCVPRIGGDPHRAAGAADVAQFRGTESILLVEDNDLMRNLTARLLRRFGYDVVAVATAADALSRLAAAKLLMSDVTLGEEMAGPILAREARATCPGLGILLTTGHAPQALEREGLSPNEFPILYKPYSMHQLLAAVRGLLDGQLAAREPPGDGS